MISAANPDYDVIVAGAGHNGLVCAAYLAKAGYRVGVFERRHTVGGAVVTEEIVPGFRFDLGGSAHSFIHLTPIIDDLQLASFGLDYIDLYLIHWPEPGRRKDSWRALEEIRRGGRCRSIGVSNYTIAHLQELLRESDTVPVTNQIEFSPFLYQRKLLEFCTAKGITITAYCPLTHGDKLRHPTLVEIGRKHGKTGAQVLLRWALQHKVIAIPKSSNTYAALTDRFSESYCNVTSQSAINSREMRR